VILEAMRTLWKGAISFGLVHIPVRVYPATESKGVKFRYLHRECGTPVRYVKWCSTCEREVAAEDIASGYEYQKGQFVVLEDEDFERLPAAETKVVDILDFVDLSEIDPIYYDKTYYLEPDEGGIKAYALLRRAMLETGRVAVARVTIRTKQSLATVRVFDRTVLAMETMYWPDEIRSYTGFQSLGAEPAFQENEVRMADMLVGSLTAPFHPAKYTDDYRAALQETIRAKVEGRQIFEYREPETAKVIDLMEALRASVEAARGARGPGPEERIAGRPGQGEPDAGAPARGAPAPARGASAPAPGAPIPRGPVGQYQPPDPGGLRGRC
jgi:DNA end-binding protein Ku